MVKLLWPWIFPRAVSPSSSKICSIRAYLELDPISKLYTIGPQVLALANAYLGNLDIVKMAQPVIYEAMTKTGESASFFIKRGHIGLVISKGKQSAHAQRHAQCG